MLGLESYVVPSHWLRFGTSYRNALIELMYNCGEVEISIMEKNNLEWQT